MHMEWNFENLDEGAVFLQRSYFGITAEVGFKVPGSIVEKSESLVSIGWRPGHHGNYTQHSPTLTQGVSRNHVFYLFYKVSA